SSWVRSVSFRRLRPTKFVVSTSSQVIRWSLMSASSPEVDPSEVGLDQARLTNIERHFDRFVDDRRLPGFLAVVTRRSRVAYVSRRGFRGLEHGPLLGTDTR